MGRAPQQRHDVSRAYRSGHPPLQAPASVPFPIMNATITPTPSVARVHHVAAVIEIAAGADGELPHDLLAAAYEASRWGLVVLLLRGMDRDRVDRALNPIVRTVGLRVHGILYIEEWNPAEVVDFCRLARLVVASTSGLRDELSALGIVCADPTEVERSLEECLATLQPISV
jgi:hypothetical protein